MQIDFAAELNDLDGNPIKADGEKNATLSSIACTALLAVYADEQNLAPSEKVNRFQLALVATKGGMQDMKVEDVAMLKRLIGKAFGPLIVGRAYDILEPAPKAAEKVA